MVSYRARSCTRGRDIPFTHPLGDRYAGRWKVQAQKEVMGYHYRCSQCGHTYRSTGQRSACPVCKSEKVKLVKRQ